MFVGPKRSVPWFLTWRELRLLVSQNPMPHDAQGTNRSTRSYCSACSKAHVTGRSDGEAAEKKGGEAAFLPRNRVRGETSPRLSSSLRDFKPPSPGTLSRRVTRRRAHLQSTAELGPGPSLASPAREGEEMTRAAAPTQLPQRRGEGAAVGSQLSVDRTQIIIYSSDSASSVQRRIALPSMSNQRVSLDSSAVLSLARVRCLI